MPERYQYPVDEGFADRIHTPEGVRSLVVKSQLLTSSPTFALRDSGGGFPLVGDI
ncbi:Uncharacterised protein [Klebsiella pneumoniae]|uniref:Uncharacterized protein n=1 Tax=Klebsiella pneumoniae TaxID=573 RepID=A0A377Y6R8_KLEPN|nr:Uncharacterised protein [Klebsiella pneumoniae]